ncbi:MAG TPA: DUF6522 family protein [Steroidobacteraceae bacterium]|jgi:hypothetical protein|nr:DUF6522 family protein [Steroidobacteraceae bacterium]
MNRVEFERDGVHVDAAIVAAGLAIEPARVLPLLREGKITARCERGIRRDAGRTRLTFFHQKRCLQLVADAAGNIVDCRVSNLDDETAR